MTLRVTVRGSRQVRTALEKLHPTLLPKIQHALELGAEDVKREAERLIAEGPKTGRIYTHEFYTDADGRLRRGRERSAPHQASAPGEAPASDEGTLANSIVVDRVNGRRVAIRVAADTPYAFLLEFGTARMEPRPFLRRAFRSQMAGIIQRLREIRVP